jgi:hypothetical protein
MFFDGGKRLTYNSDGPLASVLAGDAVAFNPVDSVNPVKKSQTG